MKCPYRNFEECLVEQCPSCNYEAKEYTTLEGRKYPYWSDEYAIKIGSMWEEKHTRYEFVSCKLIENNVQPVPSDNTIINNNNTAKTNVSIRRSVF